MKTYIKPETIAVEMLTISMVAQTGVTKGKMLGKNPVPQGEFYSKSDNAWDDWDE